MIFFVHNVSQLIHHCYALEGWETLVSQKKCAHFFIVLQSTI
jgi:hypothetical protein